MAAKQIFWYCAIVLLYAIKQENDWVDLFYFFLRQKKHVW